MACYPFIIHHGEDPDGIIAASIISQHCHSLGEWDPYCFPIRYDNLQEKFCKIVDFAESIEPRQIFIADINYSPQIVTRDLLSRLAKAARPSLWEDKILWLDHHQATRQLRSGVLRGDFDRMRLQVIYNENQCAALLAAQHFDLNRDSYFHRLTNIAQAHDYAQPGQASEPLAAGNLLEGIICLANSTGDEEILRKLVLDLRNRACFAEDGSLQPKWNTYSLEYQQQRVAALEKLEKSLVVEKTDNYDILFALSPPILSQKPASRHLREKYGDTADVIICFFEAPYRNHLVQGRKGERIENDNSKKKIDVVEFCQAMGGGGRNNKGGFTTLEQINDENYALYRKLIAEKLASFFR